MKDTSLGTNCLDSDFDTRPSAKKICFTNGLEIEVIDYKVLRINANNQLQEGNYELYILSHHVDSTGNQLWGIRYTTLSITVGGIQPITVQPVNPLIQ